MKQPSYQATGEVDNRLRWKCRRGMLELDIILNNFLETGYSQLDGDGAECFEQLLSYEDNSLFGLLMGKKSSGDESLTRLIITIRAFAKQSREL